MKCSRRTFLAALSASPLLAADRKIQTVTGPVNAAHLGVTLMHEHVLVDFIGAEAASPSRYNPEEVFQAALPKLQALKLQGCQTLVECTPAYLGRDPPLLQRLSKASGLYILTNTGYYGAAKDKFVPKLAWSESADQIAKRWIAEAVHGIEATRIHPAFLKIGVDAGPLEGMDAKLIEAAAICHHATGLKLHVHTGDGIAARSILDALIKRRIKPEAYVWVHAQNERDLAVHEELGRAGVWLEWDGINASSAELHLLAIVKLAEAGLLQRLLLSQDSGWYRVGETKGGQFNGYIYLFQEFLPKLKQRGISERQIRQLLVQNPGAVLTT